MADRLNQLKAFVAKERSTMKSFNDPKNIEKHKWYIKESLTNMKGEMLREIDSMLQDKRVTLMRQYNNHNDSLRREITELENERKEIYNFKFNDGAAMKNAKVRSYLAQEFRDLKARLSKKKFNDQKSKWITGLATIKDALKNFKSAEYINDRKIDIKKDGKLIDTVNAESLDEAVKIYERQHPELRGQIDAYFSDGKMKDARSDMMEELGEQYDMGVQSKRKLVKILMEEYNVSESQARQTVERFARDLKEMGLPIRDSLSEKAKQLISKAVAEARFDYKTAMDFAVADLKAEKEWAWTNQAEVSQMVQRLIKNRMDF